MKTHLLDYFEETAIEKAGKTAVRHNDQEITFGDLMAKAKKTGTYISSVLGGIHNRPVAVFLPKEINTVIADLGIMYSANPFMNLDIKTPQERIMNIFNLVKPAAVITGNKYLKALAGVEMPVINIYELAWDGMETDEDVLNANRAILIDTDPFCLINTSSSTGTPKGVVLNHRSFFDFMTVSNERFGFDGSEIIGSLSPDELRMYNYRYKDRLSYDNIAGLEDITPETARKRAERLRKKITGIVSGYANNVLIRGRFMSRF